MIIRLDNFSGSTIPFAHNFTPQELALAEVSENGEINISGRILKKDLRIEINGKISGKLVSECCRCLLPAEFMFDAPFAATYVTLEEYEKSALEELHEADLEVAVFDGETIDLADLTREQIYLNLPNRPLCQENCLGLCLKCGANLNIEKCKCESETDSRWNALNQLKIKD